ncbi:MAG: hypothetical protein F9K35_01235 [Burkholderiaceae bacterium]|nr:MAG: hypothetical protein F9K35_01235 [Burkholderiaceae bacterium]
MSTPNAKTLQPKAQASAQEAGASADAAVAAAVVQSAPAAQAPDEHHGRGGLYTMKDGKRVLVEQTQTATTKEAQ